MHEAIGMHIHGLIEDGIPVPESHSSVMFVAVQAEQDNYPDIFSIGSVKFFVVTCQLLPVPVMH